MNSVQAERNRIRRRDKKAQKKRTGMRVDDSAKKLAQFKKNKVLPMIVGEARAFWQGTEYDPYNGRSRVD